MNWRRILIVLTALSVSACYLKVNAQTRISGNVSGLWEVRGSPYDVIGNITLGRNDTLRIDPGVVVNFLGNYSFTINGQMKAEGTEEDTIFFYGAGQPGSWQGLAFSGPGADRGHMSYCNIRFAQQGISVDDADPQIDHCSISFCNDGISANRSLSKILNCKIYRLNRTGIKIGESSRAIVRACSIYACLNNGILVNGAANPIVDHNYIDGVNDNGIQLSSAAPCSITYNKIMRAGTRGISVAESNGAIVMRNIIDGANGPGGYLYSSGGVLFVNNTIINSGDNGIQVSLRVTGTIANCIIENSGQYGLIVQGSNPSCDYNDVYNSGRGDYSGIAEGGHDVHFGSALDRDYNPQAGSALIDAGSPMQPPDPDGTRAEIGAGFRNQNRPPVVRSYSPLWPQDTTVMGDRAYVFSADVIDPDGQFVQWKWFVNGQEEWRSNPFTRTFNRDGEYTVRMLVDDRYYLGQTELYWRFNVNGSAVEMAYTLPEGYSLSECYPNPFNAAANLKLVLPRRETVGIDLLDMQGRRIQAVARGNYATGEHRISFEAGELPSGEYLIRAEVAGFTVFRRIILMK